jgi:frataxin
MYRVVYNVVRTLNKNVAVKSAGTSVHLGCRHLDFAPSVTSLSRGRFFSGTPEELDEGTYINIVNETLESLGDKFSEIVEDHAVLEGADVALSDGVLTVNLGPEFGIYVINKQTPNKQIWLSSPISGPQRFEFVRKGSSVSGGKEDSWIYSRSGLSLHQVLDKEIGEKLLKTNTGFQTDCFLGGENKDHA